MKIRTKSTAYVASRLVSNSLSYYVESFQSFVLEKYQKNSIYEAYWLRLIQTGKYSSNKVFGILFWETLLVVTGDFLSKPTFYVCNIGCRNAPS